MKFVKKNYTSIFLWIILMVLICYSTRPFNLKFNFEPASRSISTKNGSIKYVLYWIAMWRSATFYFGSEGFEVFKHCQIKACFATHDHNLIPINEFDAIVFHAPEYSKIQHGTPLIREPHQRYIFASMEPPTLDFTNSLLSYERFYNWTMTYRTDSDVIMPYGSVIENKTDYIMPDIEFVKNKTGLAAWIVSHCFTSSKREKIVKNLQKYVKVDIYGDCGHFKLNKYKRESIKLIEKRYKFYFSFENSYCMDYVTEKLFNILKLDIVPIVYGGAEYEKIAPPRSIVVADKFASAKQLAEYLIFLDENPEEYLKYFEWKTRYYIETYKNDTVCQLCKMLHDPSQPQKIYEDILFWWAGKEYSHCKFQFNLSNISYPIY